jgi:hypothetical protein
MGSGPRLYTESQQQLVSCWLLLVIGELLVRCYQVSYREWSRERKMVIEEVKVQSFNEVLI